MSVYGEQVAHLEPGPLSAEQRAKVARFKELVAQPEFEELVLRLCPPVSDFLIRTQNSFMEKLESEEPTEIAMQVRHELMMAVLTKVMAASTCTISCMGAEPQKTLEARLKILCENIANEANSMMEEEAGEQAVGTVQ
jgi:hypothetical protein